MEYEIMDQIQMVQNDKSSSRWQTNFVFHTTENFSNCYRLNFLKKDSVVWS